MNLARPFLIVAGDFVKTGGQDRANYALAEHLANKGHEVHLVAHRVAHELSAHPGVTCHFVPKPLKSAYLGESLIRRKGRALAKDIQRRGGRVIVNGGNCDFADVNWVHYVHAAYRPSISATVAHRAVHAMKHRTFLRNERRALRKARLVVANSHRTRDDLVQQVGIDPACVSVLYYGIESSVFHTPSLSQRCALRQQFQWDPHRPVVAFVGALGDRRKGFDTLFGAWRALSARNDWDALLLVIGTGRELPAWQERARECGLGGSVRFMGFRSDVPDLLRAADLLVAPTRYEAYGLGVHEALSCGIPAIVTRSAGVAEQIPQDLHEHLLLDSPDDAHDLACKLVAWRERRDAMHRAIVPLAQRLGQRTWDRMAEEFLGLLETD
jgi:glycosyltransferase involved in cell wall biosynthesis